MEERRRADDDSTRSNEKNACPSSRAERGGREKLERILFSGSKEDMNSFGFYLGGYSCYPKKTAILRAVAAIGSLLPVDLIRSTADRDIDLHAQRTFVTACPPFKI